MTERVTGADAILRAAVAAGIDVCFANPGTTEIELAQRLERHPQIRPVLCVFEGVCTGAADGYARMTGRPALTLLHLGPGLAYGLPNLHNARRAGSPVVNLVGQHATWHLPYDAPLTSDIEGIARSVSKFVHTSTHADTAASDLIEAVARATELPSGVSTLIVPSEVQWTETASPAPALRATVAAQRLSDLRGPVQALRQQDSALVLGGRAMSRRGLVAADRIRRATQCAVLVETFPSRLELGPDLLVPIRIPPAPRAARKVLAGYRSLVLAGSPAPVAFFCPPWEPAGSRLYAEGTEVTAVCDERIDVVVALEALADELGAPAAAAMAVAPRVQSPTGALNAASLCTAVAATQPEHAIVINEASFSGRPYYDAMAGLPPCSLLTLTGGAIGQGVPCAVGAAVAAPGQRVIAMEGDGTSLYTIQALWSMAREKQDVTVVIFNNARYQILREEIAVSGAGLTSSGSSLTSLSPPALDYVKIAEGFGVEARRVRTADDATRALRDSYGRPGPFLIEGMLETA